MKKILISFSDNSQEPVVARYTNEDGVIRIYSPQRVDGDEHMILTPTDEEFTDADYEQ